MLCFALLLVLELPLVEINGQEADNESRWTYNLKCHECAVYNTFFCENIKTCPYEIRRCLTVATRIHSRELLVYKNCTSNCTFLQRELQPPEAPKIRHMRTNIFYFTLCCNSMNCNSGGPTNIERDIMPDVTLEEELVSSVLLNVPNLLLSLASLAVSNALTGESSL